MRSLCLGEVVNGDGSRQLLVDWDDDGAGLARWKGSGMYGGVGEVEVRREGQGMFERYGSNQLNKLR